MFRDEDAFKYLYHYTTLQAFLGHILPSRRLRFSPFSEVNDPRESKDWFCSLTLDSGKPEAWDVLDISRRFTDALKGSAKVLCLTRDEPGLDPQRIAHLYGRGYAHSRMWDRYAGGHTGVCLMFDIGNLGDEIAQSVADKGTLLHMGVSYNDMPTTEVDAFNVRTSEIIALGLEEALRAHRQQHHGALYFYKSTDWASEFEYRWVLLSDGDQRYEFADISNSLAGVIFGPDYPDESIPMVKNELADKSVVLARLRYMNGHPLVVPVLPES